MPHEGVCGHFTSVLQEESRRCIFFYAFKFLSTLFELYAGLFSARRFRFEGSLKS